MFEVLLSCYQNTSWKIERDRKRRTQKWAQTTRKSDSQTFPSLCLSVYEHTVSLHIIFGTNLGKYHSSKRHFLHLYNYRRIINIYHQRWKWPSASEWGAKRQQISVFRHMQIFRVFSGGAVDCPSIPSQCTRQSLAEPRQEFVLGSAPGMRQPERLRLCKRATHSRIWEGGKSGSYQWCT